MSIMVTAYIAFYSIQSIYNPIFRKAEKDITRNKGEK